MFRQSLGPQPRRVIYTLGVVLVLIIGGVAVALTAAFVRWQNAADYPNATRVGGQNLYRFSPHFTLRRDTSYESSDEFNTIYNYYSNGFQLGPEQHALGACILMAQTKTQLRFVESDMAVTLCDTPKGRMIFIMRSLMFRWR